jgi:hypothetical protein
VESIGTDEPVSRLTHGMREVLKWTKKKGIR